MKYDRESLRVLPGVTFRVWRDGELLGETPLEFSILHKAIRIVVSKEFYDKRPETSCSCTVPEV